MKVDQWKDIQGQRFGRLIALKKEDRYTKSKRTMWTCKCDCGKTKKIDYNSLKRGLTTSCGCYHDEIRWRGVGEFPASHFATIIGCSRYQKKGFDLTKEFLWDLYLKQNRECALSGLPIEFVKKHRRKNRPTASLDRINSNLGYFKNNVQWLHKDINVLKAEMDEKDFLHYCNLISNHHNCIPIFEDYIPKKIERGNRWKGFEEIGKRYWSSLIRGAESRNFDFDIQIEDVWNLFIKQKGRCNLTGLELYFPINSRKDWSNQTASLDRINSSKGYTLYNIQWIHKTVNRMKWGFDQDYFIYLCKTITEHQNDLTKNVTGDTIES